MSNKKLFHNKIAKGIVSFVTIIILLSSILASSIFYQNNITANVAREVSIDAKPISIQVKEVNNVEELNQLNEGWYQIINGYVYYLESFDSYVFLYIKIRNPDEQNGLLVVDGEGNIKFDETFNGLPGRQVDYYEEKNAVNQNSNEVINENKITAQVTGLERVSGFATQTCPNNIKTARGLEWTKMNLPNVCRYKYEDGYGEIIADYNAQKQELAVKSATKDYSSGKIWEDWGKGTYVVTELPPPPTQRFAITVADSKNNQYIIHREAPSRQEAERLVRQDNWRIIRVGTPYSQGVPEGNFEVKEIDGRYYVERGTYKEFVPRETDPYEYAERLAQLADINKEYRNWLSVNKYQDTKENRERFERYPPPTVNRYLIGEALEITPAQKEDAKKEKIQYEKIKLPDDTYLFIYNKKEYRGDASGNPPSDLQGILNFKKEHPTAVLQEGFKTENDRGVYLEKGNFIDETGAAVSEATKKEKIGEQEYDVTYKFEKGKKIPTKIKIDEEEQNINDNVLNALKSKVGKDDTFIVDTNSNFIVQKTITTKEGKEDTETYKETTTAKTLIYDSNGLKESETSLEVKDNKGNTIELKKTTQTYTYDAERNQDVPAEITEKSYIKKEGEASIYEGSSDYTEITTNSLTGEPLKLTIKEGTQTFTAIYDPQKYEIDTALDPEHKAYNQLSTLVTQFKTRQFFANLERVLTEFRGLGYYATLFFDEDSLLAWRDTVDRAFATLYLGTEYISSGLCSTYIDGEDEGIAYAETPQGLAQIGAHIEATRTQEIQTDKGREFIYKITFAIRNGDFAKDPRAPEEMNFNVVLKGEQTVNVFRQDQEVKRGSTFSRTGRNAIVQDSTTLFTQVCIRFDEIPLRWKLDNKELCNAIVEVAGEATPLTTTTPTTTPSPGTAPESEINDF